MKLVENIKKNFIAVIAVAITMVTLNSFVAKMDSQWYKVDTDEQTILYDQPIAPPGNSGACKESFNKELCAIEIKDGATPSTVDQAELDDVDGGRAHKQLQP